MLYNVFSIVWEFHFGTLVFALYFNFGISIVEIKIKIRTFFKSLVSDNMVVEKNLRVTINFYETHCLPIVTRNKNDLSKQVASRIYTLKKRFLERRQRCPIRSVLLVIIGWLVGWYRSFLRNGSNKFSDFLHEVRRL